MTADSHELPPDLRAVIEELRRFVVGRYRSGSFKGGLFQPPYEKGERLLVRQGREGVRRMRLDAGTEDVADRAFLDDPSTLHGQGMLMVTDRRARLVGNRGKVLREWQFADLRDVYVLRGFGGVHLVRRDDVDSAEVVLHSYTKVVGAQSNRSIALAHLETELAWQLARGTDPDVWLSRLPARMGL